MFKSRFPAILMVQTMFTPVFGCDKHSIEVRFRLKTMCKKLNFFGFYINSDKITGKVGIALSLVEIPTPWVRMNTHD